METEKILLNIEWLFDFFSHVKVILVRDNDKTNDEFVIYENGSFLSGALRHATFEGMSQYVEGKVSSLIESCISKVCDEIYDMKDIESDIKKLEKEIEREAKRRLPEKFSNHVRCKIVSK